VWALWLPVFLACLQTLLTVIATAISRAGAQPWWPGLELHYGYLVTPLPLCAWLVILWLPRARVRATLLTGLSLLIGYAFLFNAGWRVSTARTEMHELAATIADITGPLTAKEVASQHIHQLYWLDDEKSKEAVTNGLMLLRQLSLWRQTTADD
jgi:hypothetical protein